MILCSNISLILSLTTICIVTFATCEEYWGELRQDLTIPKLGSPHQVNSDLVVMSSATLRIQPGARLEFAAGVKLRVFGTLVAEGTSTERITLTKMGSQNIPSWPDDIRLANGSDILEGVVQVKFLDSWRSICANSANWTAADAEVVCRQLGFAGPLNNYFTYNFTATEYHKYIAITQPGCTGSESRLLGCPGAREPSYSSQICREQRSLYLKCQGLRDDVALENWHGLDFLNSTFATLEGLNESISSLKYVDVLHAGVTAERLPAAALSAYPTSPFLDNVRVQYSAYDGVNLTDITGSSHIDNCEFSFNRGQGLNITTNFGQVFIRNSKVHHNMGNGIYVRTVDKVFRRWHWRTGDFCSHSPGSEKNLLFTAYTCQTLTKKLRFGLGVPGYQVTISPLEFYKDPEVQNAQIFLYNGNCRDVDCDGGASQAPLMKVWNITNLESGTIGLPQSEVTSQNYLTVVYTVDRHYKNCTIIKECVRMRLLIQITYDEPSADVVMTDVESYDNNLYGVMIDNPRSFVKVNGTSRFERNQYGAGFAIRGGACDVRMIDTVISGNANSGLNITYSGGRRILERVKSSGNDGVGIYIDYIKEHKTRFERHQKTELIGVTIENNSGVGLRVGNYCLSDSLVVVNASSEISNNFYGVHALSCYHTSYGVTNVSIADTKFIGNRYQGFRVAPMLDMVGIIRNSTFSNHSKGALMIDNSDDLERTRAYLDKTVEYSIESNSFTENSGRYVVFMRLTETQVQRIAFRYNELIDNAVISSDEMNLKYRSRAPAVLIISSSNVLVNRNWMSNPASNLEVSTHSLDTPLIINLRLNWWSNDKTVDRVADYGKYHMYIAGKLMDQQRRYNLAQIDYYPALISNNIKSDSQDSTGGLRNLRTFYRVGVNDTKYLGGKMIGDFVTEPNAEYIVDSDIQVSPNTLLKLTAGTIFHFHNTVGAQVNGKIIAEGTIDRPIRMQRLEDGGSALPNITWMRLADGENEMEGVLEMEVNGEWGTVCNKGWTIRETTLVCKHFGLTLLPEIWQLARPPVTLQNQRIIMSHVRCMASDFDIRDCLFDSEFNDCTHDDDVTIKCVPPTWAGVFLSATAQPSQLRHVHIEKAGLLDYSTNEFVPALRIDMYNHDISDISITQSASTGMRIVYSEPFRELTAPVDISRVNVIARSNFSENMGDGLSTMSSYLTLSGCRFTKNGGSGFAYNPILKREDAFNIRRSKIADQIIPIERSMTTPIMLERRGVVKYLQAKNIGSPENYEIIFEVQVSQPNQRVTLQLLDYSPDTSVEKLVIADSRRADMDRAVITSIEEDIVELPIISSGNTLTFKYRVSGTKSGRLFMAVSAMAQTDVPERQASVPQNVRATIRLEDCVVQANTRGLLLTHYNNPSNEHMDLFIRHRYEQVILDRVTVQDNTEEAMFIPSLTKYNEIVMPNLETIQEKHRMANITYIVTNSRFTANGEGIRAEHNHVDFSNNMMRWRFVDNVVERNRYGGFNLELPLILDPYNNGNHSVEVNNSGFTDNSQFEFLINGGYVNLTMFNNSFTDNVGRNGLVVISGMEKAMWIEDNKVTNNQANFIMEIDINSHSEFGLFTNAEMNRNEFRQNSPLPSNGEAQRATVKQYTLALRGVQKVNFTRNLFVDSAMPLSFIADLHSSSLETLVNVTENYWGTIDQSEIRRKILDFSDWASFAVADFWPFLLYDNFDSAVTSDPEETVTFDLSKPLGGIVTSDLVIPYRSADYLVVSDLTVSKDATLTIEPGVTFRMSPNIGIFVLGTLWANGLSNQRIRFLPALPEQLSAQSQPPLPLLQVPVRDNSSSGGLCYTTSLGGVRLCGSETPGEGFIQLFNETSRVWSLVCDSQFNDRTAEVFCRSMGFHSDNVAVRYSELFEFFTFQRDRRLYQDLWTRTFLCKGNEDHVERCGRRINYNLETCATNRRYVYIKCGQGNLDMQYQYWGNIRFAADYTAAGGFGSRAKRQTFSQLSSLRHVTIQGAGRLHELKVPAVMSTYKTISTYELDIRDCLSNGLDFISPQSDIFLLNSRVENNLGTALNILVLNGQTLTAPSQFKPLNTSSLPYNIFGLVNLCDSEKVLEVDRRLIIYYKYDFENVDCVKVIRNIHRSELHIRFLQVNLFRDDFSRNYVEIFDGTEFSPGFLIKTISDNSTDEEKATVYSTTTYLNEITKDDEPQYQMGLHIHASAASGQHGFIAEITTDISSYADGTHRVIGNKFANNQGGSLRYSTVGEKNPGIVVTGNVFENSGLDILNLTSHENVLIEAQNVAALSVSNNRFHHNNGSCTIWLHADGDSSVRQANVSNNIFFGTTNGEALRVYGNKLQRMEILYNYFTGNLVDNLNTIDLRGVIVNVTGNTVYNNLGAHCMDIWSDTVTDKQTLLFNQFYGNRAGDKFKDAQDGGNKTLVYIAGYNKDIHYNWFQPSEFSFLMSTHNKTLAEKPLENPAMRVNAEHNFWGESVASDNTNATVMSRMHDFINDRRLSMINFEPFFASNESILEGTLRDGLCLPGWRITAAKKCYRYYGGIATYYDAQAICQLENSTLVKPKNQFWVDIGTIIAFTQQDYSDAIRAWVDENESNRPSDKCAVVIDSRYDEAHCSDRLPFICESEQIGVPAAADLLYLWIIIGVASFLGLVALILLILWWLKSRVRKEQRFERRASLRSSIRSNKYAITTGALTATSHSNLESIRPASRGIGPESRYRSRAGTIQSTGGLTDANSIALTDATVGETSDTDVRDDETVFTTRTAVGREYAGRSDYGAASTGYAGSVDNPRGSRDDLSHPKPQENYQSYRPPQPRNQSQQVYNPDSGGLYNERQPYNRPCYPNQRYESQSNPCEDYQPIRTLDSPPPVGLENNAYNHSPKTTMPSESIPETYSSPEHHYINTSHLQPRAQAEAKRAEPTAEQRRQQMYNQSRPSRPAPSALPQRNPQEDYQPTTTAPSQPSTRPKPSARPLTTQRPSQPPSRQPPAARPRGPPPYDPSPRGPDFDTKSMDSFSTMSDMSYAKPPPSYFSGHYREHSDELKKPFQTDIDSLSSYEANDKSPLYNPSSRGTESGAYRPPGTRYNESPRAFYSAGLPRHLEADNMSEMTEDSWVKDGPPVETDF